MSKYESHNLWANLRQRISKIALITSIVFAGVISSTSGCGTPLHNCSNCGYSSGQVVFAQFPDGSYILVNADVSGCASVSTRSNCNQVAWAGL